MVTQILLIVVGVWLVLLGLSCTNAYVQGKKCESLPDLSCCKRPTTFSYAPVELSKKANGLRLLGQGEAMMASHCWPVYRFMVPGFFFFRTVEKP